MCYTIEKNLTREELEKRYGAKFKTERPYSPGKRISGFSLPDVPVITMEEPAVINQFQWGLIPFWTKDALNAKEIRVKTLNAQGENMLEKPSFRHTVKGQRCLVLTNGYYEWQHSGKDKIPYFIRHKEDIAFTLGGLFDSWTNKETGEIIKTFTIITTPANPLMEKIHNTKKRMPLILDKSEENRWIDGSESIENILKMIRPYDENQMTTVIIDSTLFRKTDPNKQGSLF